LEKVRTVAMGMTQPGDLLDVCKVLFKQLFSIGFVEIRNAMINIHNDADKSFINYDYSDELGKSTNHLTYGIHPLIEKQIKKIRSTHDAFSETYFTGKDLTQWKKFRKRVGEKDDPRLKNRKGLYYYLYSIGTGSIGISTFGSISNDKKAVLKRFSSVFQLSYRRYVDITKAEAQAREAKIEAALEKIRSRSLAMHQSKELKDVIGVTFEKLNELKVLHGTVAIQLFDRKTKNSVMWVGNTIQEPQMVNLPYDKRMMLEHTYLADGWEAMMSAVDIINKEYSFVEKNKFFKYIFSRNDLTQIPESAREVLRKIKKYRVSLFTEKNSALFVDSFSGESFSKEDLNIIKRTGKVFEQAYIRFLDLQKAEAQAREAQIEAALERVRSRAMAMQTSEELNALIGTVFTELTKLDLVLTRCVILIYEDNEKGVRWWMANSEAPSMPMDFFVKYTDMPFFNEYLKGWQERSLKWQYVLEGENKFNTDEFLFRETQLSQLPDFVIAGMRAPDRVYLNASFNNFGNLTLASLEPLSDEHFDILLRFAKVFDLTYTRFNDLQKAEAQAREAQIELGLERVRARAMAMQNSNELGELVAILFDELVKLDLVLDRCIIWIFDSETLSAKVWMANSEDNRTADSYHIKRLDHPYYKAIIKAWKEKKAKWVYDLKGANKRSIDDLLLKETELSKLPEAVKSGIRSSKHTSVSGSFNNFGFIEASGPAANTEEQLDILNRFGKVFDLSYTRFNDLQNAESQAREARIEAALERVRAKAMAMHKSQDLNIAVATVFEELNKLNLGMLRCGIGILDKGKETGEFWTTTISDNGVVAQVSGDESMNIHPLLKGAFDAWLQQEDFSYILEKGDLIDYYKAVAATNFRLPESQSIVYETGNLKQHYYFAVFPEGGLYAFREQDFPREAKIIMKRFANVFNLTYKRFLDLQKAEAQAREAQIQLALERVRARTMAMQKSEELAETSYVLFQQFTELGEAGDQISIGIFDEDKEVMKLYSTFQGNKWNSPASIKFNSHPVYQKMFLAWKDQKTSYVADLAGTELQDFNKFKLKVPGYSVPEDELAKDRWVIYLAFFSNGLLSYASHEPRPRESIQLLERFASVFDLTYTRFLDLKQAEAQAKESQIQLALERVRARTMAMQHSNELGEAASLLFKQISDLGIRTWTSGFNIWQSDGNSFIGYNPTPSGDIAAPYIIPSKEDNFFKKIYQAKVAGEDFIVFEWKERPLAETYRYMKTLPIVKEVLKGIEVSGFQLPTFQINHCVFFAQGFLLFITLEPYLEAHDIFKRFGKVFEQTYTRFLDLQKAEAQAREARIEASLERVRSKAMAMHSSTDLSETLTVFYRELKLLGVIPRRCGIAIMNDEQRQAEVTTMNTTEQGDSIEVIGHIKMTGHRVLDDVWESWQTQKEYHVVLRGNEIKEYYQVLRPQIAVPDYPHDVIQYGYYFMFKEGDVYAWTDSELTNNELNIFRRFTTVISLTYKRYKDLQRAEAQTRESQIQLALERVRARTMAMHKSMELAETAGVMFRQLLELGSVPDRIAIGVVDEPAGVVNFWSTDQSGSHVDRSFEARLNERTVMSKAYRAWKDEKKSLVIDLHGDDLKEWLQFVRAEMKIIVRDEFIKDRRVHNFAYFSHGWLLVTTHELQPVETIQVLERFASVFNLTYRRFLDLQKAEAQAREAQIEAALERVRSRSMAMHQSSDLHEVVKVVTEQLSGLGIKFNAANFASIHSSGGWDLWISAPDQAYPAVVEVPYIDHGLFNNLMEAVKNGQDFLADAYDQEEKNIFFKHFFENTVAKYTPDARKEWVINCKGFARSVFLTKNIWLAVSNYDGVPFSNEDNAIFKRFANAFEQTYTRFLDLQKAEANAREAQIEASLERVRSKTMAMHTSDDVIGATTTLFTELEKLDIENLRCGISIINKNRTMEVWSISNIDSGKTVKGAGSFDMNAHPVWQQLYESWEKKEEFQESYLAGKEKEDYVRILNANPAYLSQPIREFPDLYREAYNFNEGALWTYSLQPHTDGEREVMKRFTSVFSLTFRRYQDLKKAEAQAREAQIEASLERVRAKAMAMHNSEDLAETIKVFYQQLDTLKLMPRRCGVGLLNKDTHIAELTGMVINEVGETKKIAGKLILKNHPILENIYNAWLGQEDYHPVLRGNEIKEYYQLIGAQISIENYPDDVVQFGYFFSFAEGLVYAWTEKEFREDELKIYRRFTSVLSLTYKRYKDLKQAEAQAKEAQIEAGLERVRARTMAMHTSDDVSAATATMFTELEKLGIENFRGGITNMLPNRTQHVWSVNNLAEGKVVKAVGAFNMDDHPFWQRMYQEWQAKNDFTHYFLAAQEKEDYVKILNSTQGYLTRAIENFPDVHFQVYFFNEGGVWTNSLHAHTDEEQQIMKRFTSVFSLTFRRYQDLRKAEAQAREATIEAALEKVRGKAMAMHNSNDLSGTASMVFTELRKLGINPIRCGVGLLNKESRKAQLYSATSSADGDSLSLVGWVILSEHPVLKKIYETWLNNEEYYPELQGEQMRLYYEQLLKGLPVTVPAIEADKKQYGHFLPFSVGCLYAWSETPYNDSEIKILKRFATIIDLTFRRYIELQQSEANAKEAVKQAALDRIRADIASMRTVTDLDRITPLIWNELTILGLPFIRCGVFLMDDSQRLLHTFLSTPDGRAIGAFHLPYSTPGNIQKVISHWQEDKNYVDHWDESDFTQFAEILVRQNALASAEAYLKTIPHGGFYLHFLPFLQGMLYVGNTTELSQENIQLIQSVADAFSTAYARYEDFNRLEAAKQQVEKTLTDLKQAQTQLVQSEKMASLGELTAGIAHEIQNPLNFVNNFSEVSNELIEELKIKNEKLKIEDGEVSELLNDIAQNLEKINFHGKRADAIVKGMLQHSRTSSGQKELTDINALADEYLRLAFHGLRAKDKSFNAKFETNFDDNVGKIDIIQQDIGRVILNLINNAFYAVSEKKKHAPTGYEPTVTLTTTKDNGKIEVKVKDNGNGIPGSIVDKIFQPFFTTKPTGQGTGLGLSLAYDIVKAHGGEIKVETKEGDYTAFIIALPV